MLLPRRARSSFDDLKPTDNATRQKFRKMLREGQFDDKIEIKVAVAAADGSDGATGHGRNQCSRSRACSPTCGADARFAKMRR